MRKEQASRKARILGAELACGERAEGRGQSINAAVEGADGVIGLGLYSELDGSE